MKCDENPKVFLQSQGDSPNVKISSVNFTFIGLFLHRQISSNYVHYGSRESWRGSANSTFFLRFYVELREGQLPPHACIYPIFPLKPSLLPWLMMKRLCHSVLQSWAKLNEVIYKKSEKIELGQKSSKSLF